MCSGFWHMSQFQSTTEDSSRHLVTARRLLFDMLNPFVVRMRGANINRRTMRNIRKAGWRVQVEEHLSLDVVRWIEAVP